MCCEPLSDEFSFDERSESVTVPGGEGEIAIHVACAFFFNRSPPPLRPLTPSKSQPPPYPLTREPVYPPRGPCFLSYFPFFTVGCAFRNSSSFRLSRSFFFFFSLFIQSVLFTHHSEKISFPDGYRDTALKQPLARLLSKHP